jgi:hypothetical protein
VTAAQLSCPEASSWRKYPPKKRIFLSIIFNPTGVNHGERTFPRNDGAPQASRRHWASRQGGQDSGIESYELESIRGVVVPEKDLGSPKPLYTQKLLDAIDREPVHFCQFCLVSLAASVLRLEMHAE